MKQNKTLSLDPDLVRQATEKIKSPDSFSALVERLLRAFLKGSK